MYDYVLLKDISPFHAFIPQAIHEKLEALTSEMKTITFGAFDNKAPIGICIASLDPDMNLLEILQLEVDPAHRNQQVATTLLSKTQEEGTMQGARIFSFIYPIDKPETPMIEQILKNNLWKGTRPFLIRALLNPETFNAPMVNLTYNLAPGYKEFKWIRLKPKQRQDLLHREQQGHFQRPFSPFNEEKILEPLNSLGLEYQGRVVGWMITHRINPETIRYSTLYIEPSLKFRSLAMKLLADSIRLHLERPTKWALIEIPYLMVDLAWIQFIKRRILPSATEVTYYRQGWHTIF